MFSTTQVSLIPSPLGVITCVAVIGIGNVIVAGAEPTLPLISVAYTVIVTGLARTSVMVKVSLLKL